MPDISRDCDEVFPLRNKMTKRRQDDPTTASRRRSLKDAHEAAVRLGWLLLLTERDIETEAGEPEDQYILVARVSAL